tara:strand:+ start:9 stop:326 length:318 start_codon:yes stop_codon:yes gene_type:complete
LLSTANYFAEKTNPRPTIVEIYEILKKAPRNAFDKGYPDETSIVFLPDKTALCLLRKDGNPNTAQLGKTDPPFSNSTGKTSAYKLVGFTPHTFAGRAFFRRSSPP